MKQRLKDPAQLPPEQLPAVYALARVVHHSSFSRAAVELGVSASALSQSVRTLEKRVGLRLLNRTTRSVSVTEAGERFLERVTPALELLRTAFVTLDESRGKPAGHLRISLSRIAAQMLIEPMLADFARKFPDITLDLTIDDGMADLVSGRFDAGIRLGEQLAQNMVAVPISGPLRMAVVATPEYFKRNGRPRVPADVLRHRCVRYRFPSSGAIYQWEFTENGKDIRLDVEGNLISNDSTVMVRAAREGAGLACVLELCVAAELKSGSLERVLEEFCPPFPGFFLYYPHRTQMPRKLRALIQALQKPR